MRHSASRFHELAKNEMLEGFPFEWRGAESFEIQYLIGHGLNRYAQPYLSPTWAVKPSAREHNS